MPKSSQDSAQRSISTDLFTTPNHPSILKRNQVRCLLNCQLLAEHLLSHRHAIRPVVELFSFHSLANLLLQCRRRKLVNFALPVLASRADCPWEMVHTLMSLLSLTSRILHSDAKRPCSTCVRSHAHQLNHAPPGANISPRPECTFDKSQYQLP